MAVETLIAATEAATGSGSYTFGSIQNKVAVLVAVENVSSPPVFTFEVSWDGATFTAVAPAAQRDRVFVFDVPVLEIKASFTNNPAGGTIAAQVMAYTD